MNDVRAIADAVLFEGYALYPYRASSRKNASRWQFGVVAPRAFAMAGAGDRCEMETQCLARAEGEARVEVVWRFLQLRRRRVFVPAGGGARWYRPVDRIETGGRLLVSWDEADVREVRAVHRFDARRPSHQVERFSLPGLLRDERVPGGEPARVRESARALSGEVSIHVAPVAVEPVCARLRVRLANLTEGAGGRPRAEALASSFLGAHAILTVAGGAFVSLLDPPPWAAAAAASCRNAAAFPVLAGDPGQDAVVLAAPIILYDHPRVAPESPGDLFDATEIDEILTLRTRSLTEEEKREARAADPRIAALIERVDALPAPSLLRLHGVLREAEPAPPEGPSPGPVAPSVALSPGDRVRLRPGARRTDAQDMFLEGMTGTVRSVLEDADGAVCFAVSVDGDPATELLAWHGRYHYFRADEVERLCDRDDRALSTSP